MAVPIQAKKVAPEKVSWLWRERVPRGMLTIIAGRPDQGKGLVSTLIASEVSNTPMENPMTGHRGKGQVLYSAIEDSFGLMTRPRLEAAGANLNNVHLWRFQVPAMMQELEQYIIKKHIDLVVIDPFAAHLSHGVSRHSDNIRTVLNPLTDLIEKTGTAVIIVEHVLKRTPQSGHPLASIGGSGSGIVAASRMAFLFGIDPADTDHRVLAPVKHNISEKPLSIAFEMDVADIERVGDVPFLLFDEELEFDAMRLIESTPRGVRSVGRPADKRAAAAEWLANHLYKLQVPTVANKVIEDGKQFGHSAKTLRRAAQDIDVVRTPPGGGRNCTWELPQPIIDMLNAANGIGTPAPPEGAPDGPVDGQVISDEELESLLGGDDGE